MRIRVIADVPKPGQPGIDDLIGRTYKGFNWDRSAGEITINSIIYGGYTTLNRGEWKRVSSKRKA
jgi:hypothetical protein